MHEAGLAQTIIEESGLNLESFQSLESQREKITKETIISLVDLVEDGKVPEVNKIAKKLGISKQLIDYIKSEVWEKGEWGEKTMHLGVGYNFAEILLTNGDQETFLIFLKKEDELYKNPDIGQKYVARLFAAYANSGKGDAVCVHLQEKNNYDEIFWQNMFQFTNAAVSSELVKFIFKSMDNSHMFLSQHTGATNALLKDVETSEKALSLLKGEIADIDAGGSEVEKQTITAILANSLNKDNLVQIWPIIKEMMQKEMRHDDYVQCFLFLNHAVLIMDENIEFRKDFINWMTSDNWQRDEIKRHAFTRVYVLHKSPPLDTQFEEGLESWIKNSAMPASHDNVKAWVDIAAEIGFNHPFVQRIFDLFPKDTGAFDPQWKDHLGHNLLDEFIGQGMFKELETVIRRKTSHTPFDTFLEKRLEVLTKNELDYDSLNVDIALGRDPNKSYDPVWSLPKLKKVNSSLTQYFQQVKELVAGQPRYLRRLLQIGVKDLGLLNDKLLGIFGSKNMSIEMAKSGSAIHIMTGKNLGIIVNEVPSDTLKIWEKVSATDIPVAPLLKVGDRFVGREVLAHAAYVEERQLQRAYSRFCGLSVQEYLMDHHDRNTALNLQLEMDKIKQRVLEEGISHGHPHLANFTIEFWNREFLEVEKNRGVGINQIIPKNVNDLIFDSELADKSPEKWIRVIRLIDWDSASNKSD